MNLHLPSRNLRRDGVILAGFCSPAELPSWALPASTASEGAFLSGTNSSGFGFDANELRTLPVGKMSEIMAAKTASLFAGRRILIVEDEYFLAEDIREELERFGVEVVGPASDVSSAIRMIDVDAPIDGAILDVNIKGETVFPVADLLMDQGVPFVFASGFDPGLEARRYPGFVLCRKPLKLHEIAEALFGKGRGSTTM
ncbi:response regulator [Aquibium oceanicum]|nr:hypothetical protein [Aquibium oceanicum]